MPLTELRLLGKRMFVLGKKSQQDCGSFLKQTWIEHKF